MLQAIRRLLTRPECFRLEREFAGPGFHRGEGAPWQGTPNNACERDLRPAVIQRKNTNGYRAMWSAKGEAAVRTVVATARITSGAGTFSTVLGTFGA